MNRGHIVGVEMLPDLSDEEAVAKAHVLFSESRTYPVEAFEVWDRARMIVRYPDPAGQPDDPDAIS